MRMDVVNIIPTSVFLYQVSLLFDWQVHNSSYHANFKIQFLGLDPYHSKSPPYPILTTLWCISLCLVCHSRANILCQPAVWQDIFRNFDRRNTWPVMLAKRAIELEQAPAPYMWNAILAYAASLGWGVQQGLNAVQYFHGVDLFRYKGALKSPPFVRGGPITLPAWMQLPPPIYEPM